MNWPEDVDGNVFRSLSENGLDFGREHEIDLNFDFNEWPLSERVISEISKRYPGVEVVESDEDKELGFLQYRVTSKLTYDYIMELQRTISEELAELGGRCDSWGVEN